MNKRIKELAVKAGAEPSGGYVEQSNGDSVYSENAYVDPRDIDLEKFAELIVRECCQFEETYGGDAGLVARSFSRKIREHFGVEE